MSQLLFQNVAMEPLGAQVAKRKVVNKNSYPNFSGTWRNLHSCLRDRDGFIIRPITDPGTGEITRYEQLSIKDILDIVPDKTGRRSATGRKIYNSKLKVEIFDWQGDIFKYCTHCEEQELLCLSEYTSNNRGYKTCTVKHKDAKKYHLKGFSSQPFCKNCKRKYTNSVGNPTRSTEQFIESSSLSRYRNLLPQTLRDTKIHKKFELQKVFDKFSSKCFKCNTSLSPKDRKSYQIDHTLPQSLFWNLNGENCTLLCTDCNQEKSDLWPSIFYSKEELKFLSDKTGISIEILNGNPCVSNEYLDFCLSENFETNLKEFYEGKYSRRKDRKKHLKNCDHTIKKLIKKIKAHCDADTASIILTKIEKNVNINHTMEKK